MRQFRYWSSPAPVRSGLQPRPLLWSAPESAPKNGILIKSAEALETAHHIDTVVLDKTGTITEGHPAVTDLVVAGVKDADTLLRLAASLEKQSEHPLAEALVAEADMRGLVLLPVSGFETLPGMGIRGVSGGRVLLAGNERLMQAEGVVLGAGADEAQRLADEGKTPVFIAGKRRPLGYRGPLRTRSVRPAPKQSLPCGRWAFRSSC